MAVLGTIVFSHASLAGGLRAALVVAAALLGAVAALTLLLVPRA